MAVKMTFTLDEETAKKINLMASRSRKPKSQIVRESIDLRFERGERLPEAERLRMLKVLEEMMAQPPTRTQAEVDEEIAEIRRARRSGGRLHRAG
jgi:predicted transcriptional regulator